MERNSKFKVEKNNNQIPNQSSEDSNIKKKDVVEIKEITEMFIGPGVRGRGVKKSKSRSL